MIDSKIEIYIEFRVLKSINNFGRKNFSPFFLRFCLLILNQHYFFLLPKLMFETLPNLGPTDVLSKKPTYVCSSALKYQFAREKVRLLPKTAMPQPKNWQQVPFLPNFCCFSAKSGGHRRFWEETYFLSGNPIVQRRSTNVRGLF